MWKKKLREYKGRNYKYSLRKKLHREKRTASHINNKLYNFPVYRSLRYIVKEACLHFALSSTRTFGDAAAFLGLREGDLKKEVDKFKIDLTEMTYDNDFEEPI